MMYNERNKKQQARSIMVFGMIVVVILVMEVVILMYVSMRIAAVFVVVGLIALPYAMTFSIGYLNLLKSGGHMVGENRIKTYRIWSQKDRYNFEEIEDSSSC